MNFSSNIPTKTVLCDDKDSPLMYDGVRTLLPKNQAQTQTWEIWNPLKMDTIRNRISRTMCGVIHFHMKSRGVQGRIFVQKIIEKCATNFCFENREVGIKNWQCVALISMKCFCMFTHFYADLFSGKRCI